MSEKINANSVKKDSILIVDNVLYKVIKQPEHVKPGKGPAYIQLELKALESGTKKNVRYNSSDVLVKAFIEDKAVKYLYDEGDAIVVMDENFDQFSINKKQLDKLMLKLLEDNMDFHIKMFDNRIIDAQLPLIIEKEIETAEPNIKNSTAAGSLKRASIIGGVDIKVPTYIEVGDKILLNTEDLTFVKIAKSK